MPSFDDILLLKSLCCYQYTYSLYNCYNWGVVVAIKLGVSDYYEEGGKPLHALL